MKVLDWVLRLGTGRDTGSTLELVFLGVMTVHYADRRWNDDGSCIRLILGIAQESLAILASSKRIVCDWDM